MSDVVIRKLLETKLNTLSVGVPTAWQNVPFTPVAGTAYQQVTILPARTENPTMGDGFKREVGIFEVKLFHPQNKGSQDSVARAEVIKAGFKRGTTMSEGVVRVLIDEHPFTSQGIPSGTWFVVPVSVPYSADIQG